jgi:hypothetical protein
MHPCSKQLRDRFLSWTGWCSLGGAVLIIFSAMAAEPKAEKKADAKAAKEAPAKPAEEKPEKEKKKSAAQQQEEALQEQFVAQLRPILTAELYFAHTACHIGKEQRGPIVEAGEQTVKEAASKLAKAQRRGTAVGLDARKLVVAGVAKAVKETLTPEQSERYQEELEKRSAHRRGTMILMLTSKLDDCLVLTTEQRDKLAESLTANWKEAWEQSVQIWQHNHEYFPQLPANVIVPLLNDKQKEIWRGLQKVSGGAHQFGIRNDAGIEIDENFWDTL